MTKSLTDISSGLTKIPWYVIQSCCNHEARIEERLQRLGLEVYLPRHTVISRRRDRKKLLQVPLFPGYLFVHDFLEPTTYYTILKLPGVVRFLAFSQRLAPVPPETIASLKVALAADRPFQTLPHLRKGKKVRVVQGPLAGVIGIIRESKAKKRVVVIEVELFSRALAVDLEDGAVKPWS